MDDLEFSDDLHELHVLADRIIDTIWEYPSVNALTLVAATLYSSPIDHWQNL